MPSTKKLLIIFIPAILIVSFALFVRVVQYTPAESKTDKPNNEQGLSLIPILPQDPIIGNKKAGITIIAFEDFACEACKIQATLFDELVKLYPKKIKIIWKGLPITRFPYNSEEAHKYSYCASEQNKFDEFYHLAFTNSDNLSPTAISRITQEINLDQKKLKNCLESDDTQQYINNNKNIALSLGIQAVPAIFIDNKQIKTPQSIDEWITLLKL